MKKQDKKIIQALCSLNDYIDQDKKILSDKYHNLELSHNRKIKLLKQLRCFLEYESDYSKEMLKQKIDMELEFVGRINYGATQA